MIHLYFFLLFFLAQLFLHSSAWAEKQKYWSTTELSIIKQLSINTLKQKLDPSNQYLNNHKAILFGKQLFNDSSLSYNQKVSCSSCHLKEAEFTDGKLVAIGEKVGIRNTPTLINVAQQNWFFWDGRSDSLWAQALSPLENPAEHNFTRTEVLHYLRNNDHYNKQYKKIFKQNLNQFSAYPAKAGPNGNLQALKIWKKLTGKQRDNINGAFVNIGKAIAAYVSTIKSEPTRFDHYIDELLEKSQSAILNKSEKKGLKLFISQKTGCINCHRSAIFSNKSFHNIGTGIKAKDNGRSEIIRTIIDDPFNCLGKYSDAEPGQCLELKYMNKNSHALSGSFRTPSLRSISKTAPYMHDGRFRTLQEVLDYYSGIDKNQALITDLPEISLSKQEQQDIISFLFTL